MNRDTKIAPIPQPDTASKKPLFSLRPFFSSIYTPAIRNAKLIANIIKTFAAVPRAGTNTIAKRMRLIKIRPEAAMAMTFLPKTSSVRDDFFGYP